MSYPRYNYLASFADRIAHPCAIQADMALDSFKERQHPVKIPFNKIIMPMNRSIHPRYDDLVESIREHGLKEPVSLIQTASGSYHILSGFYRCLAVMELGFNEIEANVCPGDIHSLCAAQMGFSHGPHSVMKACPKIEDVEAMD